MCRHTRPRSGIKTGMTSGYPSEHLVIADLGDKVVDGFAAAVTATRQDLLTYRGAHPGWVADHSERGLANWLHDRLWANVTRVLDGIADVSFVDVGPTREIYVGHRYRLRVKRHGLSGAITTYPTQTALAFMVQDQLALDGLDEVRLCMGYLWDPDLRDASAAVLSLRDGQDEIVWLVELPEAAGGAGIRPLLPIVDGPELPGIDLGDETDRAEGADGT